MSPAPTNPSPWMNVTLPEFPTPTQDIDVDVLVVGAGLTARGTAVAAAA